MKKHKPKWQKGLRVADLKHLKETTDGTLRDFRHNRERQIKYGIRCLECEHIARVIGMNETINQPRGV